MIQQVERPLKKLARLGLPPQIRTTVLPDLAKCCNVKTRGPSGENFEDINGRAVSIEWFLDLNYQAVAKPVVQWTSYDARQDAYQGELVGKDNYVRQFFDSAERRSDYDVLDLAYLWRHILGRCSGKWN
jgi:hypothetical protein